MFIGKGIFIKISMFKPYSSYNYKMHLSPINSHHGPPVFVLKDANAFICLSCI